MHVIYTVHVLVFLCSRRPSGNAADDQAAHDVTNVHQRLKSIQMDLLDDIKKENDELRSRVNDLQSSIESGEREILRVSLDKLYYGGCVIDRIKIITQIIEGKISEN